MKKKKVYKAERMLEPEMDEPTSMSLRLVF
jgi:hypothetical protein